MYRNGSPYDVIVVGAGHNGLVAACYLARAGLDVLVVEASDVIGGCTTTAALVPEAPDHLLGPCAADIITMRGSTIVSDLELGRHGYAEVDIDPAYLMLWPDGASIGLWRDPRRTAEDIRRLSRRDAETFLDLARTFDRALDAAFPLIASNPVRPRPRDLLRAAGRGVRRPRVLAEIASLATSTAAQAIQERFEHPVVQGALAQIASYGSPITGEGTGVNLMLTAFVARFGMGRPLGGMGTLPAALERCLTAHAGRVRTAAPVEELIVRGGRVSGVRLESGEELEARTVLTATEPWTALNELIPEGALPDHLAARVAHIPSRNDGCAHFKIEMAVRGRLELRRHAAWRRDGLDVRVPSHQAGGIDEICRAIRDARGGRLPDPLPFTSAIPTGADPSCAPSGQDTLTLWSGWVPHEAPGGWEAFKATTEKAFMDHVVQYYDGVEELEIGRWVESPDEITARTRIRNANVYHVDMSLTRMGPLRPALGFGGYRTPLPGMYITGAGTHPGPSVSGIPGQQAARTVLRDLRSTPLRRVPQSVTASRS